MFRRRPKVRTESALKRRTPRPPGPLSRADLQRLRSRWPWVRLPALIRARAADPYTSDPGAIGLMADSLGKLGTFRAARRALAPWLHLVQAQGGPRLTRHQLQALRHAILHSPPYSHADFLIGALGALARMDDADAYGAAEHVLEDAAEVAPGAPARTNDPWGFRGLSPTAAEYRPVLRRVRLAARACLNHLDRVRQQEQLRGDLLSPAAPPDDTLLRPATPSAPRADATLVRPAEEPVGDGSPSSSND